MPLLIGSLVLNEVPQNTTSFYELYPNFKESAAVLISQVPKVVNSPGLLYVLQREFAVVNPHDKNINFIGTDDTTTCCIAFLRHVVSGVVALAHFDGSGVEKGVEAMIRKIHEINMSLDVTEGDLELHLIGGFVDRRGYSERLAQQLLYAYHKQPVRIHLITACICEMNTTLRENINWPVIYGIGVNVKTGEMFPASFPDKGPDIALRSARHFTGCYEMLDIYDPLATLLTIGPFSYEPLRGVDLCLQQDDNFLLQHLSTSPEVEPPNFAMSVRATLKYIKQNPFPSVTVFPSSRPRYFRQNESGQWVQVCF